MSGKWVEIARTFSVEETQACAAALAGVLDAGAVVTLDGDLGAGKTHFTQGLAAALGVAQAVTSPTFNLVVEYTDGRLPLYHFDLYRLEHAYELEDTGIFDVLGYEGACLLEWGEQFQDELCDEYLSVVISRDADDENKRTVVLKPYGARAEELARQIDKAVKDDAE